MLRILIANARDGDTIKAPYPGFRVSKQNGRMCRDNKLSIATAHQLMNDPQKRKLTGWGQCRFGFIQQVDALAAKSI
jgi:hypothetical protein